MPTHQASLPCLPLQVVLHVAFSVIMFFNLAVRFLSWYVKYRECIPISSTLDLVFLDPLVEG